MSFSVRGSIPAYHVIWLVGFILVGSFFILTHMKNCREYKQALPSVSNFSWKLRRRVRILWDRTDTPLTYGIFRPVILIPKVFESAENPEVRFALAHEYQHIRRFDVLFKWILAAGLAVHCFILNSL